MVMFKACPRCEGDIRETSDMYGRYMLCIQCGHTVDIPEHRFGNVSAAALVEDHKAVA